MIDYDDNGRVRKIEFSPRETRLQYSWDLAVWTPVSTEFLHTYLAPRRAPEATGIELSVGNVVQAAISGGLQVKAVPVSSEPYLDIGTPEGLTKALKRFAAIR